MLSKRRRLRAAEVRKVIAKGRSVRASLLSIKYLPSSSTLRCAAVVSKKTAKTAVMRNSLRRAVYSALKEINETGEAVIFVHKIPEKPRSLAFSKELMVLLSNLR